MALPEILAVCAAVAPFHAAFASIPVDFAGRIILAPPAAVPVDLEEVAPFDFLDDQRHRNNIAFEGGILHQQIEFNDFLIGPVQVHDEDFFGKYRQILFAHISTPLSAGIPPFMRKKSRARGTRRTADALLEGVSAGQSHCSYPFHGHNHGHTIRHDRLHSENS